MNSTLDWVDFYENQKCIIWPLKCDKSRLLSVSESACFIVVCIIRYTEYRTWFDFARMRM